VRCVSASPSPGDGKVVRKEEGTMNTRSVEIRAAGAAFAVVALDAVRAVQAQDAEERQCNANPTNVAIGEL
jgi:hypothetical protein